MRAKVCSELVELPKELDAFFEPDEEADVVKHRDHLSLWRLKTRPARYEGGQLAVGQKQDSVAMYRGAYQRTATVVDRLFDLSDPLGKRGDTAAAQCYRALVLYLCGYLLEFRLKVAICDNERKNTLAEAQVEIGKAEDREYDLLGGQGHDLELLWRLAGLQSSDLVADAYERAHYTLDDYDLALRWSVSWRYEVPEDLVASPRAYNEYRQAVRRLCAMIDGQVRSHE